jgi:hypothetical protein
MECVLSILAIAQSTFANQWLHDEKTAEGRASAARELWPSLCIEAQRTFWSGGSEPDPEDQVWLVKVTEGDGTHLGYVVEFELDSALSKTQ